MDNRIVDHTKRNQDYLQGLLTKLQKNDLSGLSQGEVALLGAYQRASAEFAGTQQTIVNARAQLASLEDQAKTLLGKSSGILESLLAMKFPVEEAPSTGGNGVAKKKEKVHARA